VSKFLQLTAVGLRSNDASVDRGLKTIEDSGPTGGVEGVSNAVASKVKPFPSLFAALDAGISNLLFQGVVVRLLFLRDGDRLLGLQCIVLAF
jgi:hypothetical protein